MNFDRPAAAAIFALVLGLAGCGEHGGPQRTIALQECRLPRLPVAATCGTLEVPENRARSGGRKIDIAIAVLPANTLNPRPDPLFILAGGPGQAASYLGPFAASLNGVRKDRDIVLVDQRGTGRSSPLSCSAFNDDGATPDATLELDPVPKATACAKELAERGVDAAQYTTAAWVADLDAVRKGLGYETINLWGGSYGTRVALEYMRRHPAQVRAVVLDGVAPPSMKVSLDVWSTRDAALSAIFDACDKSPACKSAYPSLPATLAGIREGLRGDGRNVSFVDPRTGETRTQHVTFNHVIAALQPLTYVPELAALMPAIIGRVAAGDYAPLFAGAMFLTRDLSEQMNNALHYSVVCTEDAPRVSAADAEKALADIRSKALAARAMAVCDVWPHGTPSPDATEPVYSEKSVLILSGGLDPVTPPANGNEVAKTLTSSRHVVAAGYGHIVSPHECGPRLIASFLDDPTFASLPKSCVEHFERSTRPPLWTNALGAPS